MLPHDPRVRSGKYGLCSCDYCDKPTYNREIEANDLEDRVDNLEEISSQKGSIPRRYYDELQQLKAGILYFKNKLVEKEQIIKEHNYKDVKV